MIRTVGRLAWIETKLVLREPLVLAFVFGFPIVTVLVLGGVFESGDQAFEGAEPSDYYAAAYVAVVIAATGLIMLPVHLAGYRERGVMRRFAASHFPGWSIPAAHLAVSVAIIGLGSLLVVATAVVSYDLTAPVKLGRALFASFLGGLAFISIGIVLGLVLPSARAAQGVGLLLFLPMFLLGGGGPPPEAMTSAMMTVADFLPLTHVTRAIQEPWLGLDDGVDHLVVVAVMAAAATALWVWRARAEQSI